ncbi:MAG: AAA ATPase [Piccolia ochrophora]|nr:MAG: AAA ATPase [Piccolia ochrophora]
MAATVLGKRLRSSAESAAGDPSTPMTTRAKRRARAPMVNDENENPFITCGTGQKRRNTTAMDLDEPQDVKMCKAPSKSPSAPLKHNSPNDRLALSPTKINSHFKIVKGCQDENLDLKTSVPQTPRRRDALSKKVAVTPRHRVIAAGKPLTPRTPRTPSTPSTSIPTIYNSARHLFVRSSAPGRLVGRDIEHQELAHFIRSKVEARTGGCMYVSGPPGTGKSALVNGVCAAYAVDESVKSINLNCMSMKSSKDVYNTLAAELAEADDYTREDAQSRVETVFAGEGASRSICLVTLDEIDHLLSLDSEVLYKLFEWSLRAHSGLILIGIANALDLTDRFLPRLKARNLKPELLPFLPYTAPQISDIITSKLKSLSPAEASVASDYIPFIHPAAVQLCSRKVASQTGDLRRAFDVCKRAIDMVEGETKRKFQEQANAIAVQNSPSKTPLTENQNLSSPPSGKMTDVQESGQVGQSTVAMMLLNLSPSSAPRATIAHVARIFSSALGNGTSQRLQSLNIQQKAALCALVCLEKRKRSMASNVLATPSKTERAAPTVRALFDAYTSLCKNDRKLQPLKNTEFRDIVGSLEMSSLISTVDGKRGSFVAAGTPSKRGRPGGIGSANVDDRRVASCVGKKELEQAIEGIGCGLLEGLLRGDGLD